MIKIITIVGARPQFIKAAAFSDALKKFPEIKEVIIHTGQHYNKNMSDIFFNQLQIPEPKYKLESGGKTHAEMTGYQLMEIEKILLIEKPNWVLVYGDTNSTLAGALAASKIHIPIIHVEAGLRSNNMRMPEEVNRILTDRLSKILFCPTKTAEKQLFNEGYNNFDCSIEVVGDIMFDALKLISPQIEVANTKKDVFVLCTLHRAENTDDENRLLSIIKALNEIAEEVPVRIPLHPRTKIKLENLKLKLHSNIRIEDPLSYIDFINAINNCEIVISDSGGIQKEAYFLKKNCMVIRDETEWTELIESKNNILVGNNSDKIVRTFKARKSLNQDFSEKFYGDGKTAEKIINSILNFK